jgi:sec-independent protein translocase protein TatC
MSEENGMTIWDHLGELRNRLLIALLGMVVATLISFIFADRFVVFLTVPIGGLKNLVAIEVTENISVFMRVALLSGFILALPIILFEIVSYVMPGLTSVEQRWLLWSIPLASVFFLTGVAFCYYIMLPAALPFLVSFLGVRTTPRLSNYFEFVTGLMFWIGLSFEMPLLVFLLAKLKVVSAKMLAKQWRIAIVVIAVLSAIITPTPDPVNMSLLMLPLFALYILSLLFAWIARRKES